jgi:hypothetical protein
MVRSPARRLVAASLVLLAYPTPARADLFGADVPVLVNLLANSFTEIQTLTEALQTARSTYEETRRLSSFAAEAAAEFKEFQQLGARVFSGDVTAALDSSFPDLAYFRAAAASGGDDWFQNQGELSRMVRVCISQGRCTEVQGALSVKETQSTISATFGTAPPGDVEARIMDQQAALALSSAQAQMGRDEVLRLTARALMDECTSAKDLAACQAAGNVAQIAALEQSAAIADQLAQANTLQATQLAHDSAERKREQRGTQQQQLFVKQAVDFFSPAPLPMDVGQGFDPKLEGK